MEMLSWPLERLRASPFNASFITAYSPFVFHFLLTLNVFFFLLGNIPSVVFNYVWGVETERFSGDT